MVATTTAGPGEMPTFTFTNVPASTLALIEVDSTSIPGVDTWFGPFTVPATGTTNVGTINVKLVTELSNYVPSTANLVVFINGAATITANGVTSNNGNPAYLTNVPASSSTVVTVTPNTGTAFNVNLPITANTVTVLEVPSS